MNKKATQKLLRQWTELLASGEQTSIAKAKVNHDGLHGRIRRTTGQPVIFDSQSHKNQCILQNALCKELPQWANIIRSKPEIMDGYNWTRKDFIELYFGHFRLVVEKLEKIVDRTSVV